MILTVRWFFQNNEEKRRGKTINALLLQPCDFISPFIKSLSLLNRKNYFLGTRYHRCVVNLSQINNNLVLHSKIWVISRFKSAMLTTIKAAS
jgi:hypothetical protein